MLLLEIIKEAIAKAGGDGLYNDQTECGCSVDDLAPCNCLSVDCEPATSYRSEESGYEFEIGDILYRPITTSRG